MKNDLTLITIKEKDHGGFYEIDQFIEDWFICPSCKGKNIIIGYKFCPNCGVSIEFDKKVIKKYEGE